MFTLLFCLVQAELSGGKSSFMWKTVHHICSVATILLREWSKYKDLNHEL